MISRRRLAMLVCGATVGLFAVVLNVAGSGVPDVLPRSRAVATDAALSGATAEPGVVGLYGPVAVDAAVTSATPAASAWPVPSAIPGAPAAVGRSGDLPSGSVRAVVVGIDHARGSRTLRGAVRDARSLQNALAMNGVHDGVRMLLDGAASRSAVLSALDELTRVPPDGTAVFAFSGHAHISNGQHRIRTADGATITASELAGKLKHVRAPLWIMFGSCYAAGFDVPGITGPNRVVAFASNENKLAYESTEFDRSFLFQYMVHHAMERRKAPGPSVEAAFRYAEQRLRSEYPDMVPILSDGFSGDLVVGTPPAPPTPKPTPTPAPEEPERRDPLVGGCGSVVQVGGCRRD